MAFAFGGLGLVASAWVASGTEGSLAAASNHHGRSDLDGDGLTDEQEDVRGTRADLEDTDADGFTDLEEIARGSDPVLAASVPGEQGLALGTIASMEGDQISLLSAIYVDNASADTFDLRIGVVYGGAALYLRPNAFVNKRAFVRSGKDQSDSLSVIEVALSPRLVQRLGQLNMFSAARSTIPGAPAVAVSVVPMMDFDGVVVSAESEALNYSPVSGGGTPTGITYRPLARDSALDSNWHSGEACFQRSSVVGMSGVSMVHEVDGADCQPMDTYCNPTACSAGVGQSLQLPDPAALGGG